MFPQTTIQSQLAVGSSKSTFAHSEPVYGTTPGQFEANANSRTLRVNSVDWDAKDELRKSSHGTDFAFGESADFTGGVVGGAGRDRTADLRIANEE